MTTCEQCKNPIEDGSPDDSGDAEPLCEECWQENTQCCNICGGNGEYHIYRNSAGERDFTRHGQRNTQLEFCRHCEGTGRTSLY